MAVATVVTTAALMNSSAPFAFFFSFSVLALTRLDRMYIASRVYTHVDQKYHHSRIRIRFSST